MQKVRNKMENLGGKLITISELIQILENLNHSHGDYKIFCNAGDPFCNFYVEGVIIDEKNEEITLY